MLLRSSVNRFLKDATWLTAADAPTVDALKLAARELDKEPTATMMSQYRMLLKMLLDSKPEGAAEVDPVDALIAQARRG